MPPAGGPRLLSVAIHDVAPSTWEECLVLEQTVRQVADIPLTWLVVPRFHEAAEHHGDGSGTAWTAEHLRALDRRAFRGDELVLHGYTHQDPMPITGPLRTRILRAGYTQREGEFSALSQAEARRRIALGLDWMALQGWHSAGFVPPAWLLGSAAWAALKEFPLAYTTTYRFLHDCQTGQRWPSPALVYSSRNQVGRMLSGPFTRFLAQRMAGQAMVRLALHPADARHRHLLRHTQRLLRELLRGRQPVTKFGALRILAAAHAEQPSPCRA